MSKQRATRRRARTGTPPLQPPASHRGRRSQLPALAAIALLVATVLAYAPALRAPFIFDDEPSIQKNSSIRRLWPPGGALHPPSGDLAVSGRPVLNYTFAVNYAINRAFGVDQRAEPYGADKVVGYHVVNLLIHLACGLLLFALVRRTIARGPFAVEWTSSADRLALAIAALWLLHPIQTEAVDYIVQRSELLVSMFYLATLYAAARALDATTRKATIGWESCSFVACALGMGSKEVMVTAPLMVILYDRAFRTETWKSLSRPAAHRRWFYAFLTSTSLCSVMLIAAGPRRATVGFRLGVAWYEYLYTQAWAIAHYLGLFLWPSRLTLDYGSTPVHGLSGVPGLVMLSIAAMATLAAWTRANRASLAFLGTFFSGLLAPSSSFVPIVTEIAAERRIYLALAAVIVPLVVGVEWLRRRMAESTPARSRQSAHVVATAAIAVCVVLAVLTHRRSEAYAQPEILWRQVIERTPQNPRGYNGAAQALLRATPPRVDDAIPLLRRAIALDSSDLVALRSLAAVAVSLGHLEEAKTLLQREVAVDPSYADGPVRLAMVLVALRQPQLAAPYLAHPRLDEMADDDPSGQTIVALGTAYSTLGRWREAIDAYRRALVLQPHAANVEELLGDALLRDDRPMEAIGPLSDAVQRTPSSAFGLALLSLAYAEVGRVGDAMPLAAAVLRGRADDPLPYDLAGEAMFDGHQRTTAAMLFQRALELDPEDVPARRALSALAPDRTSPEQGGASSATVPLAQRAPRRHR